MNWAITQSGRNMYIGQVLIKFLLLRKKFGRYEDMSILIWFRFG